MVAVAMVSMCLVGCGSDETSPEDLAEAKKLLQDARNDGYRSFLHAPGWEQMHKPSSGPRHGAFVDLYANNTLQYAVGAGAPWPRGTLLVEDGWNDAEGTQLYRVVILHKQSDGHWFGAEYDANDKVLAAGEGIEECDSCHADAEDYVLGF